MKNRVTIILDKERGLNKTGKLGMARSSDIIPLREVVIKKDRQILFEKIIDFAFGFKNGVKNRGKDIQTRLGGSVCHKFLNNVDGFENNALTSARHMAKEPMLDRVIFRGVRRIMGNPNGDTKFIG